MTTPLAQTAAAIALHFGMLPQRQYAGDLPKLYAAAAAGADVFRKEIERSVSWGDEADYVQTLHNYAARILDYMAAHNHEIPNPDHLELLARESIYYFMQPKFSAPLPTSDQEILMDLLATAFEGGIGYWAQIIDYVYPAGTKPKDFAEGGKMQPRHYYPRYVLLPLTPGGAVILRDIEENPDPPERVLKTIKARAEKAKRTLKKHFTGEEPEGPEPEEPEPTAEEVEGWTKLRLDLPAVQKAWDLLKIQYPEVYREVVDQDYDANTADLFVQLAVFGKQIYG